ncbi:MAG: YigZ family protein [Epulopiscium sp.]|jgi:uncharacterized YigZ family protein|nr:YigZ family protein [Candidatus Epulonipiscium sp.]
MKERFKTILKQGEAEIIEKKSRFIATTRPVATEEEAKAFIEEMKKKYWNATHNVFAYQIGDNNELQRFSDDGEPQGSAGIPVLNILRTEEIKNAAVVVTRYFGGTLLGTGGLVRAYGKAAKEGLLAAGIVEKIRYVMFHIETNYSDSGKVQYELMQGGYVLYDTVYTNMVEFIVLVEKPMQDAFIKHMTEITKGQAEILEDGECLGTWVNDELKVEV